MSTQNNFYGYGVDPFGRTGMVANNIQPGVKVSSWLQQNEIDELTKNNSEFSLALSQEDILKGLCNHRNKDGSPSLVVEGDGDLRCTVCGYKFSVNKDADEEGVAKATKIITDLLQTIKLMYLSMPASVAREYFQILPLIEKIPKLYKIASNDFKKFDNVNGYVEGAPINAFAVFANMTTPGFAFGGYPQQPQMGQPMMGQQPGFQPQQQYMYQQPQMAQPMMGQPMMGGQQVAPGQNPFYQQPNYNGYYPQQAPQQGGFSLNPQGAAAPVAPAPTPAPATPDQPVKVDTSFKA
ncbi:MAG: hypothetical protein IKA36_07075 [Clostridia bacterium]|nr:hypothetical protein [Clostridia bacterium]